MNAQQFLTWMRNPGQTSREESAQLDALLDSFPYFQSGHLLYIKNLHNQGSFLYNNQLKTAAAYAVNRKVLYQLITLKSGEESLETGVQRTVEQPSSQQSSSQQSGSQQSGSQQSTVKQSSLDSTRDDKQATVEQSSTFDYVQPDNLPETKPGVESKEEKQTTSEEEISVPPQFPPKKFTSNPDEWEAGMLRQLQLLHHWQNKSADGSLDFTRDDKQTSDSQQSTVGQSNSQQPEKELPVEKKAIDQPVPDAKEEINTLLYVLVEPGQSEDIAEDAEEELSMETVSDESETTQWEIKIAEEEKTESETPIAVPSDLIQKEIMVEAIHSTFELEVDDRIPSVDELQSGSLQSDSRQSDSRQSSGVQLGSQEQSSAEQSSSQTVEQSAEKSAEEVLVTGMEMSFSQWLQEVGKPEADKSKADTSEENNPEAAKSESGKTEAEKSQAEKTEAAKKTPSELPKTALSTDVLVEQFIKDEPRINVKKSGFYNPVNMAKKSVQESDEFITETLARIYAKQGNTVKAVRAYQKLSLKFPEKTAYFAALIEELKRTPNK